MINILTEPVIRMDKSSGSRVEASLPEVYAALMADEVDAFPALRPHQRHAWHAFLVQLGAMAMHQAKLAKPPNDVDKWRSLIRRLTPDEEPWHLVVNEITKAAFMQPPAGSKEREKDYKNTVRTPDELDMLVTSKNHDLKSAVVMKASIDDWIFALVSLQTMEGYGGARNYGVSRMTSGYGNRPAFSITPSPRPGAHIRRDITALLEHRQAILDEYQMTESGIALLWAKEWNGTKAETLPINQMEPFYIEVCRRVRLRRASNRIEATRANSDSPRIFDTNGLTGDPWAPVSKVPCKRGETPSKFLRHIEKFGYERVVEGLFSQDWERPMLLRLTRSDQKSGGTMQLVARGMVRNKGKNKVETWGYHERIIPLRPKAMQVFGRGETPQGLDVIARQRIEQIDKVKRILHHAISTFIARGEPRDIRAEQRSLANLWADKLDEKVDTDFFERLQDEFESEPVERDSVRKKWLRNGKNGVVDHAEEILNHAENTLPCLSVQRYKAKVQADGIFWGQLIGTDGLPFLFSSSDKGE